VFADEIRLERTADALRSQALSGSLSRPLSAEKPPVAVRGWALSQERGTCNPNTLIPRLRAPNLQEETFNLNFLAMKFTAQHDLD
jgi:hypothetical protein